MRRSHNLIRDNSRQKKTHLYSTNTNLTLAASVAAIYIVVL